MKQAAVIFLLIFYTSGTFLLPAGNFYALTDIPDMYNHCKQTEHCDMSFIEFFTDHLINIDGIIDNHSTSDNSEGDDDQKPHAPFSFQHLQDISFLPTLLFSINLKNPATRNSEKFYFQDEFYQSIYTSDIFRPPIS